jgi:hypothetical protein
MKMPYRDLFDLIDHNKPSREYFFSLPSRTQMHLRRHDSLVTDPHELFQYADFFSKLPPSREEAKRRPIS